PPLSLLLCVPGPFGANPPFARLDSDSLRPLPRRRFRRCPGLHSRGDVYIVSLSRTNRHPAGGSGFHIEPRRDGDGCLAHLAVDTPLSISLLPLATGNPVFRLLLRRRHQWHERQRAKGDERGDEREV